MTTATQQRHSFRFRGRSVHTVALIPKLPIAGWMSEVDAWLDRSPGFFAGKPVIVDVSGLSLTKAELAELIADLHKRGIRILGMEGADPSLADPRLPPFLAGCRTAGSAESANARQPAAAPAVSAPSLLIEAPVRSGQSIVHPEGDVIVIGSIASGAEIVAAGSIHVYGALRGRALAGAYGNACGRIFCRRLDAELMAVNGHYRLADELEPHLRNRPIQAWFDGEALRIASLD